MITVVYGPPRSGKTTYVAEHAKLSDLVIDADALISAATPYSRMVGAAKEARDLARHLKDQLVLSAKTWRGDVWIIGGYPRISQRRKLRDDLGCDFIFISTDKETCLKRCDCREYRGIVESWFERYQPDLYDQDREVKRFYASAAWQRKRQEVMELDHHECQRCKAMGVLTYQRADTHEGARLVVHHVKHLRDRPDLALSIWDGEERQLITLCESCHDAMHPEKLLKVPERRSDKIPEIF